MSIIDQDEYVTRHWSPMLLSAVHPELEPSENFLLENNYSDVEEDLEIVGDITSFLHLHIDSVVLSALLMYTSLQC